MKIKTITAEIKLSKNYQTYGCTMSADLEEGEDVNIATRALQTRCRKFAKEQRDLGV